MWWVPASRCKSHLTLIGALGPSAGGLGVNARLHPFLYHSHPFFSRSSHSSVVTPALPQYVFLLLHASSCWFFWAARVQGFSDNTWLANTYNLESASITEQYIYCLYFCVVSYATVGYGDIHAFTVPEIIVVMCILMVNMVSPCIAPSSTAHPSLAQALAGAPQHHVCVCCGS